MKITSVSLDYAVSQTQIKVEIVISKTVHETFGTLSTLNALKYFEVPQSAPKSPKALLGLLMVLNITRMHGAIVTWCNGC